MRRADSRTGSHCRARARRPRCTENCRHASAGAAVCVGIGVDRRTLRQGNRLAPGPAASRRRGRAAADAAGRSAGTGAAMVWPPWPAAMNPRHSLLGSAAKMAAHDEGVRATSGDGVAGPERARPRARGRCVAAGRAARARDGLGAWRAVRDGRRACGNEPLYALIRAPRVDPRAGRRRGIGKRDSDESVREPRSRCCTTLRDEIRLRSRRSQKVSTIHRPRSASGPRPNCPSSARALRRSCPRCSRRPATRTRPSVPPQAPRCS